MKETKDDFHGHVVIPASLLGQLLPRMMFKLTLTRTPGFDEGLEESICVDDIELFDLRPDYRQADARELWKMWLANRTAPKRWHCYDCGELTTESSDGKPRCPECTEQLVN